MGTPRPRARIEAGIQTLSFTPIERRLYGRRKGRPLRTRKSQLVRDLLPQLEITLPEQGALDPVSLFSFKPKALWLEIGFGGGEHLVAQAKRHPDHAFIGCEPFLNGVASLLDHIDREQVKNIRIFPDDARRVLDALPEGSVGRCYVLFADPWPKARHTDRRFIGPANLPRLARALQKGAELCLATDDAQLGEWMTDVMDNAADFTRVRHERTPPEDWVQTRYEEKGIKAGRAVIYMSYMRK
ncbi:MAG TPA: tRNA (guanosine(46)-N7)-methyltransferase TrmB [Alphaproteobacteria bacterium]|nr:tRNA (guanosine(46)-N7)-methyltransferase TrmB [Alphaproteobacteria bacterium]